jgi:hypothetical protein
MRASEILRGLADLIDSAESGEQASPQLGTQDQPQNVGVTLAPAQEPASEQPQTAGTTFVPPLQAKIELLKKAVDVDSIYDQDGDELSQMKKMAGINPVVTDEAASDEPLDV